MAESAQADEDTRAQDEELVDGRLRNAEHVDEVIRATARANQQPPNMQQGLPSGQHNYPAIPALTVHAHLANGPCWRCKNFVKRVLDSIPWSMVIASW